jgi:3-hydroxybutyryl-CoA dehydrogenase
MTAVGIVGLGTMGLGLVQVYAQAGFAVLCTDRDPAARGAAKAKLADALARRVAGGKLTEDAMAGVLSHVSVAQDLAAFAPCALVIEAIVERLEAKRALVAELEAVLAPGAVIATNTSSLSVAAIATGARHPERIVGLHFFNPAPAMALVELVGHQGSLAQNLKIAREITENAGKTVISAPDRPGFIVNRCARPFYGEALALTEEGRNPAEIDAAMVAAGYRLGPFALIDLIGADINLAATEGLSRAMDGHPRYHVFAALRAQVARGDLGRKTGRGFITPPAAITAPPDSTTIALRIEAALVNEAGWLLAEGGVAAEGIDTALRLGLNFPRGPFEMLAAHGRPTIRATLANLAARAPAHLRGRYTLAPMLETP